MTTDSGLVADRMEYSAYGTLTYRAGTDDTPFLFNGKFGVISDPNGLLYMQSRYYNPFLCRFLNPDPSGFAGGLNLYAYANGNPITYLDPFGLGAVTDNLLTPSWYDVQTPGEKQLGEFLMGVMNLATLGLANVISSAVTGTDVNGEQMRVDEAFEESLETAAFAASFATALPSGGVSLEADAAFESADVGLSEVGGNATQLEFDFANGDLSGSLSQTTLRLPATMTDELPAYQEAAQQGLLVKTQSSALPPSKARAIWEAANGPVPEGFDVDHIIQRQFRGSDDLWNLQLKQSSLNRSEGSQAMWLNKPFPYGTIFNNVELAPPK